MTKASFRLEYERKFASRASQTQSHFAISAECDGQGRGGAEGKKTRVKCRRGGRRGCGDDRCR